MKIILAIITLLSLTGPTIAVDKPSLEQKVRKLSLKFDALQAKPDKRVPADVLAKAKAIKIGRAHV